MSDPTNSAKSDIKSYAFLDLETTGLLEAERGETKITELSIVACSKDHFLQSEEPPRVLHKLTLCVNLLRTISSKATKLSGLSNELLEQENKLNENAGRTLAGFIQHLQSPCCLIAHNGRRFDFPILKKELQDIGVELPNEVMVADSMLIFRDMGLKEEIELENLQLGTVYKHYYNKPPEQSHYAEGDVLTLMKCALKTRESFASWVQSQAIPFTDVSPTDWQKWF